MAKIIAFPKLDKTSNPDRINCISDNIGSWHIEMNSILISIEKSLKNTPTNATKDIDCRR